MKFPFFVAECRPCLHLGSRFSGTADFALWHDNELWYWWGGVILKYNRQFFIILCFLLANGLVQSCQCWKHGKLGALLQLSHFACEGGSSGLLEHTDSHWDVSQTPSASKPPGSKPVCSVTVSIACTCVAGKVILKTKVSLVCKGRLCNYLLQALKNSNWKGSIQVRRAK